MTIILKANYYRNNVVIHIDSVINQTETIKEVPEVIKDEIINALCEDYSEGTFTHENCEELISRKSDLYTSYQGSWFVVELDYSLMLKIAMWSVNRNENEIFTKEAFIQAFGQSYGIHYWEKWNGELNYDYAKAYGYFRTRRDHGQIFCDMLMEQVKKYEKRENNE